MASKKTNTSISPKKVLSEQLDELASFLYDAYQNNKQKVSDKIELDKGQIADNGETSWCNLDASKWRLFGFPQACPRDATY